MRNGTPVQDGSGNTGTVTDTGCRGMVAWVTWADGTTTMAEQVEDGEWMDMDRDEAVRAA